MSDYRGIGTINHGGKVYEVRIPATPVLRALDVAVRYPGGPVHIPMTVELAEVFFVGPIVTPPETNRPKPKLVE